MTHQRTDKSAEMLAADLYPKGQYPLGKPSVVAAVTVDEDPFPEEADDLMADIMARANMMKAYERVKRNKGAPGVDGVTVDGLKAQLRNHWPRIKAELLAGDYKPEPVRAVDIPKPGGGTRTLGIPTAWKSGDSIPISLLIDVGFSAVSDHLDRVRQTAISDVGFGIDS